jgi:hypothetical protein
VFKTSDDLRHYVIDNYPEITDSRIDDDHWDLMCPHCKITRGFQLVSRETSGNQAKNYRDVSRDFSAPVVYVFRCPVCRSFKEWIIFELQLQDENGKWKSGNHFYRVTAIPNEGLEDVSFCVLLWRPAAFLPPLA